MPEVPKFTQDYIKATVFDPDAEDQLAEVDFKLQKDFVEEDETTTKFLASKGKLITRKAALLLIDKKWQEDKAILKQIGEEKARVGRLNAEQKAEETKILEKVVDVVFGRELLMLILSQAGCEAIRFYFAHKPSGQETLVAYGVDAEGRDIGSPEGKGSILSWTDKDVKVKLEATDETLAGETVPPDKARKFLPYFRPEVEEKSGEEEKPDALFEPNALFEKSVANYLFK